MWETSHTARPVPRSWVVGSLAQPQRVVGPDCSALLSVTPSPEWAAVASTVNSPPIVSASARTCASSLSCLDSRDSVGRVTKTPPTIIATKITSAPIEPLTLSAVRWPTFSPIGAAASLL
jgi:hypothetical protein